MKILYPLLLGSFLFSNNLKNNIYSDSYKSLNKSLNEISVIKKKLNNKYNEMIQIGDYDQANIIINMRNKLNTNWGQLFGLLEVLSITNDILLFSAYHVCESSKQHDHNSIFKTISNKEYTPNPNSKKLLNLAIGKLNIMNGTVSELIEIDIRFFKRITKSEDEKTQAHLNNFAVDINNILKDIKDNINKMVIT